MVINKRLCAPFLRLKLANETRRLGRKQKQKTKEDTVKIKEFEQIRPIHSKLALAVIKI